MSKSIKIPDRKAIYLRDVQNFTGKSYRTARRMIQKVRLAYGKTFEEIVTVTEFCHYYNIEEELLREFIN